MEPNGLTAVNAEVVTDEGNASFSTASSLVIDDGADLCIAKGTSVIHCESSEDEDEKTEGVKEVKPAIAKNGKLLWSAFSMATTMVGLGVLALPYAFACAGYVGGTLLVVVCGICCDLGLVALVRVQKRSGGNTYEDQAEHFFGKVGRRIVYFLVNLDLLMAASQQMLPFSQNSGKVIQEWTGCPTEGSCRGWNKFTIPLIPFSIVFAYFMKTSIDGLKYASTFSVICLSASLIIFFVYFAMFTPSTEEEANYYHYGVFVHKSVRAGTSGSWLNFLDAIGIIFFAYVCQFQIMLLFSELKKPRDIYPIIHGCTLGFAMPLYIVVGLLGYFLFGDTLITAKGGANFFVMLPDDFLPGKIAIVSIGLTAISKMPLIFNPMRHAIQEELGLEDTFRIRLLISIVVGAICYVISQFVPMREMFIYAGSITGSTLGAIAPGLLLIQFVKMYGLPCLPNAERKTGSVDRGPLRLGILYLSEFKALSAKMKYSYITGCFLTIYGSLGGIFGLLPALVRLFRTLSSA